LIAIITVSILVLQYYLSKHRWRLDLYDKRYPVFLSTMRFIGSVQQGQVGFKEILSFARGSMDKEFLFGDDVKGFLDELYKRSSELNTIRSRLESLHVGDERTKLAEEERKLLEWFDEQVKVSKAVFGKYLSVNKR
jgi:hypothetical protein